MKTIPILLAGFTGLVIASETTPSGETPEGLSSSDWSSIRAAYEAGRHAVHRQENGTLTARNPGQQWRTSFDCKGFMVTPDHGQWTWGLELTSYGKQTLDSTPSSITHEGCKISIRRDAYLTEWFINDARGLEQGWTIHQGSAGVSPDSFPLTLTLDVRGDLQPHVSLDATSVSFQAPSGATALIYGGLKAWDADGRKLTVRFENAGESAIRISVEEQDARYPITIDPIAQQAYLKAGNTGEYDQFGASVAVSGDTVIVGAPGEDSNTNGVNSTPNDDALDSGAAYIFVRSGDTWSQQAYLKPSNTWNQNYFGFSVAVSGDTAVVGGYGQFSNTGAAYVFRRNGGSWSEEAYLQASNPGIGDLFGTSVAVSGDTIVVGAMEEDSSTTGVNSVPNDNGFNSGAAYIFTRSGTSWSQQAYLKADNTGGSYIFGHSVSISGDTVIIGSPNELSSTTGVNSTPNVDYSTGYFSGAAYVFFRNGTTWSQQAYLKASNTGNWDFFGHAVSVSGDTAVVGAPGESSNAMGANGEQMNDGAVRSGAAYVFKRSGTTWSQQAYLKASNTEAGDSFGQSISISGDNLIVGSSEDGGTTGVNSSPTEGATESGAAYFFARNIATWSQQAYLKASNTTELDFFAKSVAISGSTVIIGAPGEDSSAAGVNGNQSDNSASGSGAVYVFDLNAPSALPELAIEQSGNDIANNATKSFGSVVVGSTSDLTFNILNTGNAGLILSGTLKVAVTGSPDFTVTAQPTSPISSSGSSNFTVRFTPTGSGLKTAALSIVNNDADENPFIIQLTGTAATALVPVSFHPSTSPTTVALQFDVGFTVSGISMNAPVLQGVSSHQISSELLGNGKTRFMINSPTNTTIPPTASIQVMLDPGNASLQDGIMTISGVVATNSSGSPVSASPGAKPIVLSVSPASLTKAVIGSHIPVGVDVVDLDGSITMLLYRLNGSPVGSASSRPFTTTLSSATPGDFAFTAFFSDNAGNSGGTTPVTLRFIDPSALNTFSSFQSAWLEEAGDFNADPFNTGIPNGLAWALGINPLNPDRARLPTQFIEENVGGKTLVYQARVLASGVVHQILTTTSLDAGSWFPLPPAQIEETLESGGWRLIEARVPITEIAPRRFVQLSVQNP